MYCAFFSVFVARPAKSTVIHREGGHLCIIVPLVTIFGGLSYDGKLIERALLVFPSSLAIPGHLLWVSRP